jgi:hypothetical protein
VLSPSDCALAGFCLSVWRIASAKAQPLDIIVTSGSFAFAATLLLHGIFSYRLHVEFGWLTSAYPRYYLPLAAVIPLANLALLDTIKWPAARTMLVLFLIAGPIVFRLIGTQLG